jgi:hypothetical protein
MICRLPVLALAALLSVQTHAEDSADALIVLTTVGFLTGAADGCRVVPKEASALSSGMALAIGKGQYGEQSEAHILLNNARQRGVAQAAAGKVDCKKIADSVRKYVRELLN